MTWKTGHMTEDTRGTHMGRDETKHHLCCPDEKTLHRDVTMASSLPHSTHSPLLRGLAGGGAMWEREMEGEADSRRKGECGWSIERREEGRVWVEYRKERGRESVGGIWEAG